MYVVSYIPCLSVPLHLNVDIFSCSHILNETFLWLSLLRKDKSSSQYTFNEKNICDVLSQLKYLLINLDQSDQSWNCLINFSFSNLFSYYNTIFFHFHQNSFLDFFASKQKINKSLNFLICFDLPFPSFTYAKTFSFLGSVKYYVIGCILSDIPGSNCIPFEICKLTQNEINQHLADICNLSFKTRVFPNFLKIAKVITRPYLFYQI